MDRALAARSERGSDTPAGRPAMASALMSGDWPRLRRSPAGVLWMAGRRAPFAALIADFACLNVDYAC